MTKALVNIPSPALAQCELTFIERNAIDLERARTQHDAYVSALRSFNVDVETLEVNTGCPDGVFVEDVAVIFDELAVITTMGSPSRRGELAAMRRAIARHREVVDLALPATLEGGDVLRIGRTLYVGDTSRTNPAGIEALAEVAKSLGYKVVPVKVPGCLHLKTCITALDDETCVVNKNWLDIAPFQSLQLIDVAPSEPWGANVLRLREGLVLNASTPETNEKIRLLGYKTTEVNISEFGKAEAGLTCMSLLFGGPT
jgi:dimethylargininase